MRGGGGRGAALFAGPKAPSHSQRWGLLLGIVVIEDAVGAERSSRPSSARRAGVHPANQPSLVREANCSRTAMCTKATAVCRTVAGVEGDSSCHLAPSQGLSRPRFVACPADDVRSAAGCTTKGTPKGGALACPEVHIVGIRQ